MGNPLVFGDKVLPVSMHIVFLSIFLYFLFSTIVNRSIKKKLVYSYLILVLSIFPSVIFSEYVDVSILKFISFAFGIFSLLFLSNRIRATSDQHKQNIYISYRNINRLVLLFSLIIYIVGLGYTANETGFAGFLNHPQVFGVFLVLAITTEMYGIHSRVGSMRGSLFAVFVAFTFSLMTESRLSIISIIALFFIYIFIFLKIKISHLILLLSSLAASILMIDKIQTKIQVILTKSGRSSTSGFEALEESRGFLVSASLNNFKDNPIFGIGFQVSNGKYGSYDMNIIRDSLFGLPIEAVVEKGVFWTALLEEVGLLGAFGFLIFLFSYYKKLPKKMGIIIISAFFLVGLGESFFFTLGGMGGFAWCIIFMFYAVDDLQNEFYTE